MTEQYEVYPGKPPSLFLMEFFQSKQITIEAFCKNERISPYDFKRMAEEIMTEWELTEATHTTNKDAVMHLINHIRIKYRNEQRNNTYYTKSVSAGQNTSPNERMARIAQEIIRQSAGGDQS